MTPSTDKRQFNPRQRLSKPTLKALNQQSNRKGLVQLLTHLTAIGLSGYLWGSNFEKGWLAVPFLLVYGFSIASLFAALHECIHRTAFADNRLNSAIAQFAGLLSFNNSTFFDHFHQRHHRYTQIPGKDPELAHPKPSNRREYLLQLSGLPWWRGQIVTYWQLATGKTANYPFLGEKSGKAAIRSARGQLFIYAGAIALTMATGHPEAIIWYWLLPLAVGQPMLRFILLAEHTGCSYDNNPLTNTRTTLTLFPIRLLMWNMPYHAEHHLYPSLPFHALPAAHQQLAADLQQVEPGYLPAHRNIVSRF